MASKDSNSKKVATAAIKMALSDRKEEGKLKKDYKKDEMKVAAVDFGGDYNSSIKTIIERAIIAAKRENVIKETHTDQGAVAGATREALTQLNSKAIGFNVGGKIGIARQDDHISVAIFFAIGLLHLNEMAIGLGHRAVT
ncbi:HutP family protein [Orenia marismortui]|uniref:HutP family protein n=1 Tax=Orenia marismortui TaxID=46469 RepID=UPI00037B24B4|nr:HutP family protein [Orenia marismortui]